MQIQTIPKYPFPLRLNKPHNWTTHPPPRLRGAAVLTEYRRGRNVCPFYEGESENPPDHIRIYSLTQQLCLPPSSGDWLRLQAVDTELVQHRKDPGTAAFTGIKPGASWGHKTPSKVPRKLKMYSYLIV